MAWTATNITKPATSIAQWALLSIITAFGYDQTLAKGAQSASAQTGILVGWVAPVGVLMLICFFTLALYPLAGEKWDEIKKELSFLHREKEKKYLEEHDYKFVEEVPMPPSLQRWGVQRLMNS